MKIYVFCIWVLSFYSLVATAQKNKEISNNDDIKLIYVEPINATAKNSTKGIKSGGISSKTDGILETAKTVRGVLETPSPNNDVLSTEPNLGSKTKPEEPLKDINAISYHETFKPVIDETALEVTPDSVYVAPQVPATFVGGLKAMSNFFANNIILTNLPPTGKIKGKIWIGLAINKYGVITNATIKKGLQEAINKEALRIATLMPLWKPAMHNGQVVKTYCTIPIEFTIE